MDAREALLGRLIDHAPLFPPASLPLVEALEEHRRARGERSGLLLRRFVCPASRLAELPAGLEVAAVLDGPLPAGVEGVAAVETAGFAAGLGELAPEVYVELPPSGAGLEPVAAAGYRAKVRCGGASVPSVNALAGFVRACRDRQVPFKATAGLHHAVAVEGRHGFLNLLAAVIFGDEEQALEERDRAAFHLDGDAFRWRGREAVAGEIARARRESFVAFGSCDAQGPAEELRALGFLQ